MSRNQLNLMRRLITLICLVFSGQIFALAAIEEWRTSNGMKVLFVAAPELPMVDFRMVFHAGSSRDGERLGLSLMTSALIADGTEKLTADEVAQGFESLGAEFYSSADRDSAVVGLRSLTDAKLLKPSIALTQQLLSAPAFPQSGFARVRQQTLVAIQAKQQSPAAIAGIELMSALYPDHPYGLPKEGTEETLMALSPVELKNFYHRYYVAKNGVLAIVGNLTSQEAQQFAQQLADSLQSGQAASPIAAPIPVSSAQEIHVDFPSTQTHIFVAQLGMAMNDPDYFPLYVGNHVLGGGGFISRLMEEVRSKRGLSYSVYSYFQPMQQTGPFLVGLQTKNNQVEEAKEAVETTLSKFLTEGPKQEELEASKQNITGGFPLRLDSNRKIVDYLAQIAFYQLPLDYLETFNEKVEAVTIADVKRAFRRLDVNKMLTVTVGGKQ